jgi:hypothetical protein
MDARSFLVGTCFGSLNLLLALAVLAGRQAPTGALRALPLGALTPSSPSPCPAPTATPLPPSPCPAPEAAALCSVVRADAAANGAWTWTAVYRGNATRPPHLEEQWTSQVGQDRTLVELFSGRRSGFFLDLASNHAATLSNTLTLEQSYGWRGICVEANPAYEKSYAGRSCTLARAVVGPFDNERVTFTFDGSMGGVQGFDQRVGSNKTAASLLTVSVARLLRDLSAPAVIDYLSLDIEGAEWWAFSTFPWRAYVFLAMTVERPKPALVAKLVEVRVGGGGGASPASLFSPP